MSKFREQFGPRSAAWVAGFCTALELFAIWRDGEQIVGCGARTLKEVLNDVYAAWPEEYQAWRKANQTPGQRRQSAQEAILVCPSCGKRYLSRFDMTARLYVQEDMDGRYYGSGYTIDGYVCECGTKTERELTEGMPNHEENETQSLPPQGLPPRPTTDEERGA